MSKERDIAIPSHTKEILATHGFSFKKSLGQNFLIEPNILQKIVATATINEETNVIEIGPGIGALTEQLARKASQVLAFEIDQRLINVLADTLKDYSNVTIINQDILEADVQKIADRVFCSDYPIKVVANLPYYITTSIMTELLESDIDISEMVVMMQKEVAERIVAKPGSKAYGSLSVAIQYYMKGKIAFIVPKTVFVPQPNVDSAILHLEKRATPAVSVLNEKVFFKIVRASFQQRRKTLWNNLLHFFGKTEEIKAELEKVLQLSKIDPKRRGETLSLEEFATLANTLFRSSVFKEHVE